MSSVSSAAVLVPRCFVVIPCAGSGSRAGRAQPKQYAPLAGERLVDHTVATFLAVPQLAGVGLVLAPDDESRFVVDARVQVFRVGGASRAASVHNGLRAWLAHGARVDDWVLVHDAARCLLTPAQVSGLIAACEEDPVGGLLALPLPDTLKSATASGRVHSTISREGKWLAQTPQMFRLGKLDAALTAAAASQYAGITDEASAIEAQGEQPLLVPGSAQNFKVTYPEDFALAEAVLWGRANVPEFPCPAK